MSKIIVKEFWQDPKKRQIVIWAVVLCALYFLVPLFFTQTKKPVVNNEKDNGTELFSVAEVSQMEEKKTLHIRSTTEPEQNHTRIYTALNISPKILSTMKTIR